MVRMASLVLPLKSWHSLIQSELRSAMIMPELVKGSALVNGSGGAKSAGHLASPYQWSAALEKSVLVSQSSARAGSRAKTSTSRQASCFIKG